LAEGGGAGAWANTVRVKIIMAKNVSRIRFIVLLDFPVVLTASNTFPQKRFRRTLAVASGCGFFTYGGMYHVDY
jgi:hypothetical protein